MDSTSLWQVSALQTMGIETMTLSSRLRSSTGGRGTLQDLEDTINSTGKRRIAKLGMSIADPEVLSQNSDSKGVGEANKTGSMTSQHSSEDSQQLSSFDIDVFTRDYRLNSAIGKKEEHIFGRAETSRGHWDHSENSVGRDPHDGFDQGPALQRYAF